MSSPEPSLSSPEPSGSDSSDLSDFSAGSPSLSSSDSYSDASSSPYSSFYQATSLGRN